MHEITSIERRFNTFTRESQLAQKIGECVDRNCRTHGCPIVGQREMCWACSLSKKKDGSHDHAHS